MSKNVVIETERLILRQWNMEYSFLLEISSNT